MKGYIFFDNEAYQIDDVHLANLIIAQKQCINCINKFECNDNCGLYSFENNDEFNKWLFNIKNSYYTAIAHNMQVTMVSFC